MKNKILYFCFTILLITILITFSGCEKDEELNQNNNINEVSTEEDNTIEEEEVSDNTSKKTNNTTKKEKTSESEDEDEEEEDDDKVDKLSDVTWKYKKIDFSDLKWLNTEECGNICIPSSWNRDKDFQVLDENSMVYDTEDASEVIIIDSFSSSMLKTHMEAALEKLSSDNKLEEWSYEQLKFNGQNVIIINAKFSGINHVQSNMFIVTEDQSRVIEVCVEAPDPNVRKLLNTFTFEELEEDAVDYFEVVNEE